MIARQRDNLRRTFAAAQQSPVAADTLQRITTNQQELLDATTEFTNGLLQFGPMPPLEDALVAMRAALDGLAAPDLSEAQAGQEQALRSLIRARQNLRQILKMSNSSSASQCRQFDRQQQQKLRPPQEPKQQEQEQQLAEVRDQICELADQQRKWSEDVRSNSSQSPSDTQRQSEQQSQSGQQSQSEQQSQSGQQSQSEQQSQSGQQSQSSQQSPASPQTLAERQRQALEAARQLAQQLQQSGSSGQAAPQRMEQAAEAIESSLQDLAGDQADQAAERAAETAEQLDELAEHLAALNAAEFGQRLGHAQRMADRLARQQRELAGQLGDQAGAARDGTELPDAQRALAGTTDLLADLLDRVTTDAVEQTREARQMIDEVRQANPPRELARTMRGAAAEIEAGQVARAGESADHAARGLEELSDGLRRARGRLLQPQLEELVALEKLVAELLADARRGDANEQALLQQRAGELQQQVDSLAGRDPLLAQALEAQRQAGSQPGEQAGAENQGQPGGQPGDSTNPGNATSPSSSANQPGGSSQAQQAQAGGPGNGSGTSVERPRDSGFNRSRETLAEGLRELSRALQARIQEAILASVLQESDEAVPPEYRELVEQYYRELSDDLR